MTFAGVALTAPSNDDGLLKDEKHFLEQSNRTYNGGQKAMQISANLKVVAHDALGDRGFNGDVWAHEGYAYVGPGASRTGRTDRRTGSARTFRRAAGRRQGRRPPATPLVSTLQNPVGTSAEDVVVYTARHSRYRRRGHPSGAAAHARTRLPTGGSCSGTSHESPHLRFSSAT